MEENKNFCYWQDELPYNMKYYNNIKKVCLLRQNEYKLLDENHMDDLKKKINIFCPYINAEKANECNDYILSKGIKWDKS